MKKSAIILLLLALFIDTTFGQTIEMLERKNGFRGIKLGTNINSYPFFVLTDSKNKQIRITEKFMGDIVRDEYFNANQENPYCKSCKSYVMIDKTEGYSKFTGADIFKLSVHTYRDTIYEIDIFFRQTGFGESNRTVFKLYTAFGYPNGINFGWDRDLSETFASSGRTMIVWRGKNISLTYISLNGLKYNQGSKRIAGIATYNDDDLYWKARLENEKNSYKPPSAIDDF